SVGSALGTYDSADIEGGRVKVFINGDLPLKFECKVGFDNGDVVKVTIKYEDLHRHCYTCKRITHEEGTCPDLSEVQREKNRLLRIEQKDQEERATKEAFSTPYRRNAEVYQSTTNHRDSRDRERRSDSSYQQYQRRERRYEERHGQETSHDLRNRLTDRREAQSKDVWNRLDNSTRSELPRNRERYHPYHNSSRVESRGKYKDTGSSSEWRPKERQEMRTESYLNYANQKEKQVERFENHSYRRRISPDSQRTISENVQSKWQRGHLGGRRSRSPPTHMEWRPVRKDKATTPTSTPRDQGLEERRNNGQVGLEGLTENGIADDETNVEKEAATFIPSLEKESETNINVRTEVARKVLGANSSHLSNCEHGYSTKDKEEDDIDKIIDEYAELAMNEEPVDDDDLLDEISEGEIPEKENLAAEQDTEDGWIEAISQLSPSRATSLSRPENMKKSAALDLKVTSQEITTKRSLEKNNTMLPPAGGKRRGSRSPELKGASASKKLANRGRLSPKICQVDAPWIDDKEATGLGFSLLDENRPILFGARGDISSASPLHAEAERIIWALQELLKIGRSEIHVLSDCEQLVKIIHTDTEWPALAPELDEIKALSNEFLKFSIAAIPRSLNTQADSLTKSGRSRKLSPLVSVSAPTWLVPGASLTVAE
ncbi:hypothetical protein IGI04_037374, partial [Brassica rapa subsp. trilocularis]